MINQRPTNEEIEDKTKILLTPRVEFFSFGDLGEDPRLMTVIFGIPFYRSTGINSGKRMEGTMFPNRGILQRTNQDHAAGWIMKPKILQLPEDVINFFEDHYPNFSVNRFGTLQTLCISASIGTGFWETKKGLRLKEKLFERYANLFLQGELAEQIRNEQRKDFSSFIQYREPREINAKLTELGSVIPLNEKSRLPTENEIGFFHRSISNPAVLKLLSMLLTHNLDITENMYNIVVRLSQDKEVFAYIVNYEMLSDKKQLNKIIELANNETISVAELRTINTDLEDGKGLLLLEIYSDLLRDSQARNALKKLKLRLGEHHLSVLQALKKLYKKDNITNDNIEMIEILVKKNILVNNFAMLNNNKDHLTLLKNLNELELLDRECTESLQNSDLVFNALLDLLKMGHLNKTSFNLVKKAYELGFLKEFMKLFNTQKTSEQLSQDLSEMIIVQKLNLEPIKKNKSRTSLMGVFSVTNKRMKKVKNSVPESEIKKKFFKH